MPSQIALNAERGLLVRGSPCHFPEETLEGYRRAIEYGVDYIEMDVVRHSLVSQCPMFLAAIGMHPLERAHCHKVELLVVWAEQVSTKDGHLICRHDLTLDDSTDVAEHAEYAERKWVSIRSDREVDILQTIRMRCLKQLHITMNTDEK
jgi:hypothetical protein